MPQLVRAGLRYNRWLETEGRAPLDFPADVITDLKTTGDEISVFAVTDSIGAERVAIAVSAGKQDVGETAYGVFDQAALEGLGLILKKKGGATNDSAVNEVHYDLHIGTIGRLVDVTGVIATGEIVPILRERVKVLLREGFEKGQLDWRRARGLCDRVKAKIPGRAHGADPGDERIEV